MCGEWCVWFEDGDGSGSELELCKVRVFQNPYNALSIFLIISVKL